MEWGQTPSVPVKWGFFCQKYHCQVPMFSRRCFAKAMKMIEVMERTLQSHWHPQPTSQNKTMSVRGNLAALLLLASFVFGESTEFDVSSSYLPPADAIILRSHLILGNALRETLVSLWKVIEDHNIMTVRGNTIGGPWWIGTGNQNDFETFDLSNVILIEMEDFWEVNSAQ